jgi:hypothetical protein
MELQLSIETPWIVGVGMWGIPNGVGMGVDSMDSIQSLHCPHDDGGNSWRRSCATLMVSGRSYPKNKT